METWLMLLIPAVGIFMGLLTTWVGLRTKIELPLWTVLYLGLAVSAGLTPWDGWLDFGVFTGLSVAGGLFTGTIQAGGFERYAQNNPWHGDQLPSSAKAALKQFVPFGIIMGAIYGAIFAGVAWALSLT